MPIGLMLSWGLFTVGQASPSFIIIMIYITAQMCAVELGYTIFDYICLRGWVFTRPAKASVLNPDQEHIEYR
jgi:hypothetical protein